jgi:amidohydrolase
VKVRAIFQPAEEVAQGARESVEAGLIRDVDAILSIHVDPSRRVGEIGLRDGAQTACCDELQFTLGGSGGHGARPHETSDTILAVAHLIQTAHALIPRIVDARDDTVLSFCKVVGGHSANVIPTQVELLGTLRSFAETPRARILDQLRTLADTTAKIFGVTAEFQVNTSIPSVTNCPALNQIVKNAANEFTPAIAVSLAQPSLGGEDFACYQLHIPGSLIRVGSASADRFRAHLHSPHFDVDEKAIGTACQVLVRSLIAWFEQKHSRGEVNQ